MRDVDGAVGADRDRVRAAVGAVGTGLRGARAVAVVLDGLTLPGRDDVEARVEVLVDRGDHAAVAGVRAEPVDTTRDDVVLLYFSGVPVVGDDVARATGGAAS